jgi:hypothetical protein
MEAAYCEGIGFACAWGGDQKPVTNQIEFTRYVDTCRESVEVKIRKIDKGGNLFNLSDDFCGEQVVTLLRERRATVQEVLMRRGA